MLVTFIHVLAMIPAIVVWFCAGYSIHQAKNKSKVNDRDFGCFWLSWLIFSLSLATIITTW